MYVVPHEAKEMSFLFHRSLEHFVLSCLLLDVSVGLPYRTEGDKIEIYMYHYKKIYFLFGTFKNAFFLGLTIVSGLIHVLVDQRLDPPYHM